MTQATSPLRKLLLAALLTIAFSELAFSSELPTRTSPRPETTNSVPHIQIGIEVDPELKSELLRRVDSFSGVEIRDTIISLPGAQGFWLSEEIALKRPEAIVGGREFAHVHPDGSLHASLSPNTAIDAVKAGWATPHPWSDQRPGWEGFVMIYTPQSDSELEVVIELVKASFSYVTGIEAE